MLPSLLKLVWKTQKPHLKRKSLFISLIQRNSIFTVKLVKWSWQYQVLFTYFPISYLCLTLSTRNRWIHLNIVRITYLIIDRRIFSIEKHNKTCSVIGKDGVKIRKSSFLSRFIFKKPIPISLCFEMWSADYNES